MVSATKKKKTGGGGAAYLGAGSGVVFGGGEHVRFAERGPEHEGLTGTNAFPDVDAFSFGVPHTALGMEGPIQVELPDTGGVSDETRHGRRRAV